MLKRDLTSPWVIRDVRIREMCSILLSICDFHLIPLSFLFFSLFPIRISFFYQFSCQLQGLGAFYHKRFLHAARPTSLPLFHCYRRSWKMHSCLPVAAARHLIRRKFLCVQSDWRRWPRWISGRFAIYFFLRREWQNVRRGLLKAQGREDTALLFQILKTSENISWDNCRVKNSLEDPLWLITAPRLKEGKHLARVCNGFNIKVETWAFVLESIFSRNIRIVYPLKHHSANRNKYTIRV